MIETPGEVFIVVDRHRASVFFEYLDAGFEEFVARIENLSFFVTGIISVFSDDQYRIDGKLISTATQGLRDSGEYLKSELFGPFSA